MHAFLLYLLLAILFFPIIAVLLHCLMKIRVFLKDYAIHFSETVLSILLTAVLLGVPVEPEMMEYRLAAKYALAHLFFFTAVRAWKKRG